MDLIKAKEPILDTFRKKPFDENIKTGLLLSKSVVNQEVQRFKIRYNGTLPQTIPALDNPKRATYFQKRIQIGPGRVAKLWMVIESLFEDINVTEVSITVEDGLVDWNDISKWIEDILSGNQIRLTYVDVRMQFFFQRFSTFGSFGHLLEFVPSWLYELDLASYLERSFNTIKKFILNDDEEPFDDLLWTNTWEKYYRVKTRHLCPCALSEESHYLWLDNGFCITHLGIGH